MREPLIQQAGIDDLPILLPLIEEYWRFESISGFETKLVAEQLKCLFADSNLGLGWIARTNGVAVGYLLVVFVFSLENLGVTAEIDEFFILPNHRRSGTGSRLLRLAEAEIIGRGCTGISLQLARSNHSARAFYHRNGYVERERFELIEKPLTGYS